MIKAQQLGQMQLTGQQVPMVPLQAGTIPGYTGLQIDMTTIMNLMMMMMVMVMMVKMMGTATKSL